MLVWYFALTFAVWWFCWVAAAAVQRALSAGPALPVLATVLLYGGTFAPAVVALSMTARSGEPGAGTTLLDRVLQTDVPARWYAFAVGSSRKRRRSSTRGDPPHSTHWISWRC